MPDYNSNAELAAHAAAQQNYDAHHASWSETNTRSQDDYEAQHAAWETTVGQLSDQYQSAHDAWQVAHDAWVANPGDPPAPEPEEPQRPEPPPEPQQTTPAPEPQPPAKPGVYKSRDVTAPELIETATGEALVVPPRLVMTAPDGTMFALTTEELAAGYTAA